LSYPAWIKRTFFFLTLPRSPRLIGFFFFPHFLCLGKSKASRWIHPRALWLLWFFPLYQRFMDGGPPKVYVDIPASVLGPVFYQRRKFDVNPSPTKFFFLGPFPPWSMSWMCDSSWLGSSRQPKKVSLLYRFLSIFLSFPGGTFPLLQFQIPFKPLAGTTKAIVRRVQVCRPLSRSSNLVSRRRFKLHEDVFTWPPSSPVLLCTHKLTEFLSFRVLIPSLIGVSDWLDSGPSNHLRLTSIHSLFSDHSLLDPLGSFSSTRSPPLLLTYPIFPLAFFLRIPSTQPPNATLSYFSETSSLISVTLKAVFMFSPRPALSIFSILG